MKSGKMYQNSIRLNSPRAVHRLLARSVNMLIQDQLSEGKARAIGYLASVMMKGLEVLDIEKRLTELEEQLARRKAG